MKFKVTVYVLLGCVIGATIGEGIILHRFFGWF